jgi:hypothetical protein
MKRYTPVFKDDTDRIIVVAMLVASLFFMFIPALVVVLCLKKFISDSSYEISKAFLNFELLLFLISLFFMVPIIGWLFAIIAAPIMVILNTIIIVIDLCAIAKNSEVKVPVGYEFI